MNAIPNDRDAHRDDLVASARKGDPEALDLLLRRLAPKLAAEAERCVRGDLAARLRPSDLVQSAAMQIVRGFDAFRGAGEAEFAAWALRVLKNEGLQRRRWFARAKRAGEAPAPPRSVATPSRDAARREEHALLLRAMDALESDQREALRLKLIEDLPHAEIARRLGRSEGAARMLLARARRNLALGIEKLERP
ncbi:MAG TPA: sigma-70 family RNA polymerase sigma factor [Planctomycetota bacterium]|nr:sigma-70 family RNA polymerase sigma factor [Planctomycetota bacterium]